MEQQYLTPSTLSSGKFARFTSPMFQKGCWRIGTISDGSCFFHAIVTSLSKSYRSTEIYSDKIDKVKSIRSRIGSKIDASNWENLQNGEPCQFKFLEHLRLIETVIVKVIKKPNRYTGKKDKKWVFECIKGESTLKLLSLVTNKNLFEMNEYTKNCSDKYGKYKHMKDRKSIFIKIQLKTCVENIERNIKSLQEKFESSAIECAVLDFKRILEKATEIAEIRGLKDIVRGFSNPSTWVGTEYLSFLGDQFNMNIFIVTGDTGLPYPIDEKAITKGRSNIFLLHVDECHFESLGFEIDSESSRPKIRCKLDWDSPIVQKFMGYDSAKVEVVASEDDESGSELQNESVNEEDEEDDEDEEDEEDENIHYSSSENDDDE